MSDQPDPPLEDSSGAAQEAASGESIVYDIQALIADGKTYAEAELAFQKSRAASAGQRGKAIAIYGGLAIVLIIFALFAMVMGALLSLTPVVGPVLATVIVVLSLLVLAAICGLVVVRNAKRLKQLFAKEDDE